MMAGQQAINGAAVGGDISRSGQIPPAVAEAISKFLLAKLSGKCLLHIKDGRILGCELTQVYDQAALRQA